MQKKKKKLHLTIGNDRLSNLLIIVVESDIAVKVSLDDAVDVFSKMKNRRYPLTA
jgi:hypothetical protein